MSLYNKPSADETPTKKRQAAAHTLTECPPMPTKQEVADYFGYKKSYHFFKNVLFAQILTESKYSFESIKGQNRIPPGLAQEIYAALGWIDQKKTA